MLTYSQGSYLFEPDSILVQNKQLPAVLLVGTFHFAYYNLDAHKIDSSEQMDILNVQKQKELKELLDYIALFKPNKIAIEASPGWNAPLKYKQYKKEQRTSERNEIYQVAFRLMDKFHLDTVYPMNAGTIVGDLVKSKDSLLFKPYVDSIYKDWDFNNEDEAYLRYNKLDEYGDNLANKVSLLDYFKYLNADKTLKRAWGAYLTGDFKLDKYRGADALAMHFYVRNLRIFRNIQQISSSSSDRILVLFGVDHMSVLKQLFESSPEYKLIPFNNLR
jgi:hypothetical protein